jgi:hypothetical protein
MNTTNDVASLYGRNARVFAIVESTRADIVIA